MQSAKLQINSVLFSSAFRSIRIETFQLLDLKDGKRALIDSKQTTAILTTDFRFQSNVLPRFFLV